jgi:phage shock protein PspC (stress-responsive transcriptional regulator)
MSPLQYLAVYVVLFAVGAITLTALGLISTWAIALAGVALAPSGSSRILGVCSRLSKGLDVPVRGVRFLVALITLFTGILPGVLLYLAAGVVMSWSDGPTEDSSPGFASTDRGPVLLGVCRRLAARLDVPVAPVRLLVVLATLFTGVAPGLMPRFSTPIMPGGRLAASPSRLTISATTYRGLPTGPPSGAPRDPVRGASAATGSSANSAAAEWERSTGAATRRFIATRLSK